jgi:hypothetical protein
MITSINLQDFESTLSRCFKEKALMEAVYRVTLLPLDEVKDKLR